MEVSDFAGMMADKAFFDLKKLQYKYPDRFSGFLEVLKTTYFRPLPLRDFAGERLVFLENHARVDVRSVKLLLREQSDPYGSRAAEEEILSSSAIERIDFSRDSIRNILRGLAPRDEAENRILGQKNGLEFIANPENPITEENLFRLYQMTVGDFLTGEDRLPPGTRYRNDAVYVVGGRVEHVGLDHRLLPEYMAELIAFIQAEDGLDELLKGAMIHFYLAYLHPYFDGNGRMARMVHLWYLLRRGYRAALFVPFSSLIATSRREYYGAFTAVEENRKLSGVVDVTPFLHYFAEQVYNKMPRNDPAAAVTDRYRQALEGGGITPKEAALWRYVLSAYGSGEFSTKQLERDFGDAAYATIRGFVLKFRSLGLLTATSYGNRVRYRVSP